MHSHDNQNGLCLSRLFKRFDVRARLLSVRIRRGLKPQATETPLTLPPTQLRLGLRIRSLQRSAQDLVSRTSALELPRLDL